MPSVKHAREGGGGITESSRLSSLPLRWTWKTPSSSSLRRLGDYRPVSAASVDPSPPQTVSKPQWGPPGSEPAGAARLSERVTAAPVQYQKEHDGFKSVSLLGVAGGGGGYMGDVQLVKKILWTLFAVNRFLFTINSNSSLRVNRRRSL
ncbi:hypothetical protein B5X24_HaOG214373 [Helicoverpa armigera]|nr:hypothetical protein B5X24_HaOG214373 [Helicoverpa armigera]